MPETTTAKPATISRCARRLRACVIATAALWDAARELEIETGQEVDGIGDLVNHLSVTDAPTATDCAVLIRELFSIPEATS